MFGFCNPFGMTEGPKSKTRVDSLSIPGTLPELLRGFELFVR